MTDQQDGSIIRRASSRLSKAAPLGNPITSRIVGDLLSLVKGDQVVQDRIQLGHYSFRPQDHRQVMKWAETFKIDPIDLLGIFEKSGYFEVAGGAILGLLWDLEKLPTPPNDWEDGMLITTLWIRGKYSTEQRDRLCITEEDLPQLVDLELKALWGLQIEIGRLPKLKWLELRSCNLATLRLEDFPSLRGLFLFRTELCSIEPSYLPDLLHLAHNRNKLTEIDLMHFPGLKSLDIGAASTITTRSNQIRSLDLSPTPLLTDLDCSYNKLQVLDLSSTPLLTRLNCSNNQLKELDLSTTPLLTTLNCSGNQLKELDLSPTPLLTELDCGNNQLQSLDLKPTSSLTSLVCRGNIIKELDISQVPQCDCPEDKVGLMDPPYFSCEENPLEKIILTQNQYLRLRGKIPKNATVEVVSGEVMHQGWAP
jgi:Leucine-rich repeat (LRR) protein